METYLIIAIIGMAIMAFIGFIVGKKNGGNRKNQLTIDNLKTQLEELQNRISLQDESLKQKTEEIIRLSSERDVQIANATHEAKLAEKTKQDAEETLKRQKMLCDEVLADTKLAHEKQLATIKEGYEQQLSQVKETCEKQLETLREMNKKQVEAQLTLIKEQK